jgi:ubiquinone/menaquinone biosynthesis C-methylase UbiE
VFVRANALLLPFQDASFDAVHSSAAIQLFDRPQLAVNEMARVCRPGGALVLATFVRSSSWSSRQLQKWVGQGIGFSWFTPDVLHAMLEAADFEVREEVIEGAAITLKGIRRAEGRQAL